MRDRPLGSSISFAQACSRRAARDVFRNRLESRNDLERRERFVVARGAVHLDELTSGGQHRAVVGFLLQHLLKGGLGALDVARAHVHDANLGSNARAHGRVAAGRERALQESSRFARLIERQRQLHEAPPHIVVPRLRRADRPQQLERAGRVAEHVLPDDRQAALGFEASWPAHQLELHAQHLRGALEPAELFVYVRQGRRDARGNGSILQ
jgi:hypothetical protein